MKSLHSPSLSHLSPPIPPSFFPYRYRPAPVGLLGDAVAVAGLADPGRAQGGLKPEAHQEGEDAESEPVEKKTMGRGHYNIIYIYI